MRKIIKRLFYFIIGLLPKNKKKIVMESGPEFSDNAKALYDYLKKTREGKYKYIWLVDRPEKFKKLGIKDTIFLNVNKPVSLMYIFHIATSYYLFSGNREIRWVDLNKQKVINLTHGLPFKSSKGLLPADHTFNYLLSSSENISPYMADEFITDVSKCFVSGMPRNDIMFKKDKNVSKLIKNYDKFIIWLPTYKKHKDVKDLDYSLDKNVIPLLKKEELQELNDYLKKANILLMLKFHPAEDLSDLKEMEYSHLKLWKNEELIERDISLYSLLGQSDALITDYSSVYADYLLMDKPIAFIQDNLNSFLDKRGFVFTDIEKYTVGEKIQTKEELIAFIKEVSKNKDKYKREREVIKNFYHKHQSGNSCEIITKIFDL